MKNPKECICIQQKQIFFLINELAQPEHRDGSEPLTFHHDTFSRFKAVIINSEKQAVTANLSVRDIPGIMRKIQNLNLKQLLTEREHPDTAKSKAYSTVITAGKLKGKTPAAVLQEQNVESRQLLINQKQWLQQNLARYPKNAEQIKAIEEALKLFERGELNQTDAKTSSGVNVVFASGMRPLIRRKRKDGKCFVYELEIRYLAGLERPVEFEIRNYYAVVEKKESGLLNVTAKDTGSEIRNVFSMTMEQWCWVQHMVETNIWTFEFLHAEEFYQRAELEEKKNLDEAKKAGRIAG